MVIKFFFTVINSLFTPFNAENQRYSNFIDTVFIKCKVNKIL